jgi:hypothetical protein
MMNPRLVPQHGISLFTNIDDVEDYIQWIEARDTTSYLEAIELPIADRPKIMADLRHMNINAATLFPGYEGTCRMLTELNFDE